MGEGEVSGEGVVSGGGGVVSGGGGVVSGGGGGQWGRGVVRGEGVVTFQSVDRCTHEC